MIKRPPPNDPERLILQWIKDGIRSGEDRGLTQSGLGRALGLSPQQGNKLIKGERRVLAYEMPAISAYLGQPIPDFNIPNNKIMPVPLLCDANTNHWLEEIAFGATIDGMIAATVPAMISPQYNALPQFAARITGNVLNRKIADGAFAICVAYDKARPVPRDGDFVIFEVLRHNLHKVMARRLRRVGTAWELQPYSSSAIDKKQTLRLSNDLTHLAGSPDDQVVFRGLIIGVYGVV